MYRYDEFDHTLVAERVTQFRDQVQRRLDGALSEDEFKPLRLMNGLYLQLHAYMLRVAIPYGTLSSPQMRQLAYIARRYDRGYGHFTTRQNIQYNWPKLEETPDILADLAAVEMHAIQTSGNCIRNVTADPFAGVAAEEVEDPRIYAEIIRQWSTLHPEFSFLPRKFKIALTGCPTDRAAVKVHDIGLRMLRNEAGEPGFEVIVGGGQGRTPIIGKTIRAFLPKCHLLSYLEAILRVYNQLGRRDNLYKARIKILVASVGAERFAELVEAEWQHLKDGDLALPAEEIERIRAYFAPPDYERIETPVAAFEVKRFEDPAFARWLRTNISAHKQAGYAIVTVSLKPEGEAPGDATADQMDAVADLAERYSGGEIRVTHEQNLVLPDVKLADLHALWQALGGSASTPPTSAWSPTSSPVPGSTTATSPTRAPSRSPSASRGASATCSASTTSASSRSRSPAASMPVAITTSAPSASSASTARVRSTTRSPSAGRADEDAALGNVIGPSFSYDDVVDAVETIVNTYLEIRREGEEFLDTYGRVGLTPFKEVLYAAH